MLKPNAKGERLIKKARSQAKPSYTSKSKDVQAHIAFLKQEAAIKNKGLKPYKESPARYLCDTCGSINLSHPETSYCFVCDSDDWAPASNSLLKKLQPSTSI